MRYEFLVYTQPLCTFNNAACVSGGAPWLLHPTKCFLMSNFYNRSPVLTHSNSSLFVPRKFSILKTWAPRCSSAKKKKSNRFPVLIDPQAVVSRPLDCSLCRECIRPPGWEQRVQLSRVKDEFLFTIESTGILSPEELFKEALKVVILLQYYVYYIALITHD